MKLEHALIATSLAIGMISCADESDRVSVKNPSEHATSTSTASTSPDEVVGERLDFLETVLDALAIEGASEHGRRDVCHEPSFEAREPMVWRIFDTTTPDDLARDVERLLVSDDWRKVDEGTSPIFRTTLFERNEADWVAQILVVVGEDMIELDASDRDSQVC